MTKPFLTLSLAILAAGCVSAPSLHAQDAPAPAAATAAAPTPTDTQRIAALEAYINNSDPTAALKGADGTVPAGLTTPAVGVPGPVTTPG